MWISLHTHSNYSFLRGLASPLELAQAAAAQQMPALALTDTLMLTGAIEFYDACHTTGIRPILGLEIPIQFPSQNKRWFDERKVNDANSLTPAAAGNLILLAQNITGWSNLCWLSSSLQAGEREQVSFESLSQHADGLVCLSGGRRGFGADHLSKSAFPAVLPYFEQLAALFADRIFLEIQTWMGSINRQDQQWCVGLLSLAKKLNLPMLATVAVHYLAPEQATLQKLVSAIRLNLPFENLPENETALPGSFLMNEENLRAALQKFPIANPQRLIDSTLEVADRCRLELPLGEHHYPVIDLPGQQDPNEVLRQRAEQGAVHLYGAKTARVHARLEHELETIATCGYASLFLIMQEIIDFARRAAVPVSSRGSAASSLVAHCLGITTPDPLQLNLYFERFLNPMRVTPPDIDTDLCSRRRDQVIQFVFDRFGHDRVAMVSTINRFRTRSALRETAKAYGLTPAQIRTLLGKLPHRWYGPSGRDEASGDPYRELSTENDSPIYQDILKGAQALIGIPRHLSIHPGGVIIAPGRLTDLAPVQRAPKGITITQFDLGSIERLGLLKIDLLGIRGLTVLGDVAEAAGEQQRQTINTNSSLLDFLDSIPHDDPATSNTLQQARTIGCFQIESPGMRATLREIQAKTVEDLMVALALYRPGPLTGGLKDIFVERYRAQHSTAIRSVQNSQSRFYLHPSVEPLLNETYGVILYQEQVLRIAHELAGFTLSDADLLRRAMSHFDLDKQMVALKEKFISGAYERSAVPTNIAERIWELMAAFAGYGFPKAHAASYAEVAWRAAWCKTHYPELFMAAVLANWGGYYSQRVYLTEARRMGLVLKPPLVNYAKPEFSLGMIVDQPVLLMGFSQVRDLSQRTTNRIIRERPFSSFVDFIVRADPKAKEAENLIRAGALDGFGNQPTLMSRLALGGFRAGQLPLFSESILRGSNQDIEDDWSLTEKVSSQEAILGVSLVAHPLELYAGEIAASNALTTLDAAARLGQAVRVAGVRQTWRHSRTQRGDS